MIAYYKISKIFSIFVLIILTMISSSCRMVEKEETPMIPENLIPIEQMVDILVDFHLIEASLLNKQHQLKDIDYQTSRYYDFILKKHEITREKFNVSLDYYKQDIEKMKIIYQDIVTDLNIKSTTAKVK